jgi:hypothetical protein
VQIVPSSQWSSVSQRAVFDSPRSLYEVGRFFAASCRTACRGLDCWRSVRTPDNGRHDEHIYHFSLGPWRLAELIWPNFSGRMFPVHRRWISVLPAEGRIWTPSIYLGLIPLLLGLSRWRLLRGRPQVRWATWITLAGTLASFGWYGLGWIVHELRYGLSAAAPQDVWIGQPVGGLYWCLVTFLPGYAMFRFPAKLFVIATLGLSLLAAWGLDDLRQSPARRLSQVVFWLALASFLGGCATWGMGRPGAAWLKNMPADAMFGPLEIAGSLADVRWSLLQTAVVGGAFWGLLCCRRSQWGRLVVPMLLVATALDLAVAQRWLVPVAPDSIWQDPGSSARAILARYGDPEGLAGSACTAARGVAGCPGTGQPAVRTIGW